MTEKVDGCVKPSKGPILNVPVEETIGNMQVRKETQKMIARIGKEAPDFELSSYFDGGFKNVKLSDYKGKWIVVCFYPGDFTFV
jgi:peroxiredoxin (alkyl hydroperoxide reductase subunit C)